MQHINVVTRRHPAQAQVDAILQVLSVVSAVISIANGIRSLIGK